MSKKLVIVKTTGLVPINGGMIGPVNQPTEVDDIDVISIIAMGHDVYEVNRANPSMRVKLTTDNAFKNNFTTAIDPIRAAANRLNNSPANAIKKAQEVTDIAVNIEKTSRELFDILYHKNGSHYLLEGDAYTHYDSDEAIEYGVTYETLMIMIDEGTVSPTKFGDRPTPKAPPKKQQTPKKKKSPNHQNFKKN